MTEHQEVQLHQHDAEGFDEARRRGHEVRDVSGSGIWWFGGGLLLVLVISLALMFGLDQMLRAPAEFRQEEFTARTADVRINQPLARIMQEQLNQQTLRSYAWANPEADVARIPIQRAIELIGQRGELPQFPQDSDVPDQAASPTEPNEEELQ